MRDAFRTRCVSSEMPVVRGAPVRSQDALLEGARLAQLHVTSLARSCICVPRGRHPGDGLARRLPVTHSGA
eukprot:11155488-Lingulodinium_polyedra.AAC.1